MRNRNAKPYKWLGIALAILGIMLMAALLRPKLPECGKALGHLIPAKMPDLTHTRLITPQSLPDFRKLAIMELPALTVGDFSLLFSPDSSMVAISGVGWIESDYSTTFLWKVRRAPLCMFEGQTLPGTSTLSYQEFSPDSQVAIVNECHGRSGLGCYSLWDTQTNGYIKSYFDAHFVQHNQMVRLEYQPTADASIISGQHSWPVDESVPLAIGMIPLGKTLTLMDRNLHETLGTVQASGTIQDIKISPDGTLMALAVTLNQPANPGLPPLPFVELWGIKDAPKKSSQMDDFSSKVLHLSLLFQRIAPR